MEDKVRMALLGELIHQLADNRRPGNDLDYLNSRFLDEEGRLVVEMPVATALDHLFNNIYYSDEYDLRLASQVVLITI